MTLRILHKKAPAKQRRAIVYAAEKWEPYVYRGIYAAIKAAHKAFNHPEVAAALARNAPEIAVAAMPWAELERALEKHLMLPIKNAVMDGAAAAVEDLKPRIEKADPPKRPARFTVGTDISFKLDNPRTQNYLARNAARLVTRIRQETMLAIRRITTDAHARGLNVGQQADKIATQLKRDIGLNQRQAGALGKYQAGLEERELGQAQITRQVGEYRDRLIDQRARLIARHETMSASNSGQQEVWTQATEQGLLDPTQKRKWITQPGLNSQNPCPICREMHGQVRGLNEEFVSPYDNSAAIQPPIHIGCECVAVLHFED